MKMKVFVVVWCFILVGAMDAAELINESELKAFSEEVSGETAKRNLEFISRQHRMRGSYGYKAAVDFIAAELRRYGLKEIQVEEFPADGKLFYGTQRSRRPWDARFAELWEMKQDGGALRPHERLASWDAVPLSLAQDSERGEVTTLLIDAGEGTSDSDYKNKDVKGKLVLVSQQPESVVRWAVDKYGAAGIISYAQNQRTAWWGENENLLRWGHVGTFNKNPAFAFMITLKQARALQKRLLAGETIQLHAKVDAGQHPGAYQVLTAVIPGSDPRLREQEIVFSCHLDHPRPGANDNASGCMAILEVARTFSKLISERKMNAPSRTLRFVWPPEIEGTITFLIARPEIEKRILTAIHLDMVGGGPVTKAQFHITRGPASRPSFVYDVADYLGDFVNQQTQLFADRGASAYPLFSPEGGKEPLQAILAPFSMGSDHEIYAESSFGIPAIYFNDWPDRYIHTNFDTPANIDPTKLKRAAFLAATSAYFLANLNQQHLEKLLPVLRAASVRRAAKSIQDGTDNHFREWYEQNVFNSLGSYVEVAEAARTEWADFVKQLSALSPGAQDPTDSPGGDAVYARNPNVRGPMGVFGYNYLEEHYGLDRARSLKLLKLENGSIYAYEALNFIDGKRDLQQITGMLSAAYGKVPIDAIAEYLSALESIRVIEKRN